MFCFVFFILNKAYFILYMNQSHSSLIRVRALGLHPCFPSQEIRALFLGKSREAFLSQALSLTYSCGVQSVWSQLLSLSFSLLSLFLELFSLSPSPMVWVHVWLVFLGTRPSWVSVLFVVCTNCVQRSASDTRWSEFPGIGDPDCIPSSLVGRQRMQEQ